MDLRIRIPIEGSLLFHLSFTILSIRQGEALVCSLRKLEFGTFFSPCTNLARDPWSFSSSPCAYLARDFWSLLNELADSLSLRSPKMPL